MKRSEKIYTSMVFLILSLAVAVILLKPENHPGWKLPILTCGVVPLVLLFLWGDTEARKARENEGGDHERGK